MEHRDAEVSDVVVVFAKEFQGRNQELIAKLEQGGLVISDTDDDEGVVEGTCEAYRVADLRKIEGVEDVRIVFNYVADYPPGDPRNTDDEGSEAK